MDIFSKDELRNEEILGGFDYQSETDVTFSLNGKEKHSDEISNLEIEPSKYQVFSDEIPEITENINNTENTVVNEVRETPTDENLADTTDDIKDIWDMIGENENSKSDESIEEDVSIENPSDEIQSIKEVTDKSVETSEVSEEIIIPKEFVDIDGSPDAVEIDINNIYPDHPSHIGIENKTPNQEATDPIIASAKAKKEKVKIKKEKKEKEKSKKRLLPILIPFAAAIILFILLTFADYKFGIFNNHLSNALNIHTNDTSKQVNKALELAKSKKYKDSVKLAKENERRKIEAQWAEKQKIQDSLNMLNNININANIGSKDSLEREKKADALRKARLEKEKAENLKHEKRREAAKLASLERERKTDALRLARLEKEKAENLKHEKRREAAKLASLERERKTDALRKARLEKENAEKLKHEKRREAKEIAEKKRKEDNLKKEYSNKLSSSSNKNDISKNEIASSKPITSNSEELYVVQVYASPSKNDAEQWLKKVRNKAGSQANISTQIIRDVTWYRVRFGNYKTRAEAEKAAQQAGFSQVWIDRIK